MAKKKKSKKKKGKKMVGLYDVEIMTKKELKKYIKSLKDETARMRLQLLSYQSSEVDVSNHLRNVNEEIDNARELLTQKAVEVPEYLREFNVRMKEEQMRHLIAQMDITNEKSKFEFESFKKLQDAKETFVEDEAKLKTSLEDRNKEIERNQLDSKFVSINLAENQSPDGMMSKYKTMAADAEDYTSNYRQIMKYFNTEKISKMVEIWESRLNSDEPQYAISKYAEDMYFYFRDILWKNIKTTTELRTKIRDLERQLNNLKLFIRDAKQENEAYRNHSRKEISEEKEVSYKTAKQSNKPQNSDEELNDINQNSNDALNSKSQNDDVATNMKSCESDENEQLDVLDKISPNLKQYDIDYLEYENDVLAEKLRHITKERDFLRKQFITAVGKIHEKADFKSYLLERILFSLHEKIANNEKISPAIIYALCPKKRNTKNKSFPNNPQSNSDSAKIVWENPSYEATSNNV